jgi:hypothetical protein
MVFLMRVWIFTKRWSRDADVTYGYGSGAELSKEKCAPQNGLVTIVRSRGTSREFDRMVGLPQHIDLSSSLFFQLNRITLD